MSDAVVNVNFETLTRCCKVDFREVERLCAVGSLKRLQRLLLPLLGEIRSAPALQKQLAEALVDSRTDCFASAALHGQLEVLKFLVSVLPPEWRFRSKMLLPGLRSAAENMHLSSLEYLAQLLPSDRNTSVSDSEARLIGRLTETLAQDDELTAWYFQTPVLRQLDPIGVQSLVVASAREATPASFRRVLQFLRGQADFQPQAVAETILLTGKSVAVTLFFQRFPKCYPFTQLLREPSKFEKISNTQFASRIKWLCEASVRNLEELQPLPLLKLLPPHAQTNAKYIDWFFSADGPCQVSVLKPSQVTEIFQRLLEATSCGQLETFLQTCVEQRGKSLEADITDAFLHPQSRIMYLRKILHAALDRADDAIWQVLVHGFAAQDVELVIKTLQSRQYLKKSAFILLQQTLFGDDAAMSLLSATRRPTVELCADVMSSRIETLTEQRFQVFQNCRPLQLSASQAQQLLVQPTARAAIQSGLLQSVDDLRALQRNSGTSEKTRKL